MGNVLVSGNGDEYFRRDEAEAAERYVPPMKRGYLPQVLGSEALRFTHGRHLPPFRPPIELPLN